MYVDGKTLKCWKDRLNRCIGIMDERGRTVEGGYSTMLDSEWQELRIELWELLEDVYKYTVAYPVGDVQDEERSE